MKGLIIDKILKLEWELFVQIKNTEGIAPCQQDKETYRIMRRSMYRAWNESTLERYLADLESSYKQNRNILAEKYGYMMFFTSPEEYDKIKHLLPDIPKANELLATEITRISLEWWYQANKLYPNLTGQGRFSASNYDTKYETSYETYLKGELYTYSLPTLIAYLGHVYNLHDNNRNMYLMILENTVKEYGYQSLEEAEKSNIKRY